MVERLWTCASRVLVFVGHFQSVEIGEELAVFCSRSEDGYCAALSSWWILFLSVSMLTRHHTVLVLFLTMVFALWNVGICCCLPRNIAVCLIAQ